MGSDKQILAAYEQGLTPEQIADALGFPLYAIKAKLMSLSTAYRKACGNEKEEEDELNLSRAEQLRIKEELLSLAFSTEDEHLKGKLLLNLRDDGKGRKDVVKQVQGTINHLNILQIVNNSIHQARAAKMLDMKESIPV